MANAPMTDDARAASSAARARSTYKMRIYLVQFLDRLRSSVHERASSARVRAPKTVYFGHRGPEARSNDDSTHFLKISSFDRSIFLTFDKVTFFEAQAESMAFVLSHRDISCETCSRFGTFTFQQSTGVSRARGASGLATKGERTRGRQRRGKQTQGSGGASKRKAITLSHAPDTADLDSSKLGHEPAAPHVSLLSCRPCARPPRQTHTHRARAGPPRCG
jgi:hypothetical protein